MKRATDADYHDWVTANINGRRCQVQRVGAFKWEVKIDGRVHGHCETRSQARTMARELALEAKR